MNTPITALVADDEPLLRQALVRQLQAAWPQLQVVAQARNGSEAWQLFEQWRPQLCFLDIHMPGASGIELAQRIGNAAHVVFVTAYDEYALKAFEAGALDYLVKPVTAERLAATVRRLQQRLHDAQPARDLGAQLQQLLQQLQLPPAVPTIASTTPPLRWIHAQLGQTLQLIPVASIDYLRADSKYTRVAWRDTAGRACEAVIATPLKALAAQLDPAVFVQVHRAVLVNLHSVRYLERDEREAATLHLHGRDELLPVSRRYLPVFRAM